MALSISTPGLITDLYELTMAQSYLRHNMTGQATFSLFIRKYPTNRAYFVSAGLEQVLEYLQALRFTQADIDYLEKLRLFDAALLRELSRFRFTGDVWAVPEGEVFFANEPVLEVTAPILQAQLVETFVLNQVNVQSLLATKAARCIWASKGKPVIDFGLRRTQGVEAGLWSARAAAIAGFAGTSNVGAAKLLGMTPVGTMAHSYIEAFTDEIDASRTFASDYPERSVLLIDTYDTVRGAERAVQVAKELAQKMRGGFKLRGVRLDSGDLLMLSKQVRKVLDDAGMQETQIVASGGLDEYGVAALEQAGAPIDQYAVGTKVGVSEDAPSTDMAYKLVSYAGRPVMKTSEGKLTYPGEKQVFRVTWSDGKMEKDILGLRDEPAPKDARPLLEQVMRRGELVKPLPEIKAIHERFKQAFAALPDRHQMLTNPPLYPVETSPKLTALTKALSRAARGVSNVVE
jgi:nicotinate phosphoribosyltransferase